MKSLKERRERDAIRRAHKSRMGIVGCRVWERSGIGTKGGLAWSVTNAAIDEAVNVTYRNDINDEEWVTEALIVLKEAIRLETEDHPNAQT